MMNMPQSADRHRWLIAGMGVLLQLCLGTIYAWSYFQKPLMATFGWTNTQVAWIFSWAILFLSLGAAGGGVLLPKAGPRRLAMIGGALFGAGYLLAALAMHLQSLPLFYFGYGVIGGTGLGFQSPMLQSILKTKNGALSSERLAAGGATLIAASSIFNELGRFF